MSFEDMSMFLVLSWQASRVCHLKTHVHVLGFVVAGISGERVWMELKKILVGNYCPSLMRVMDNTGITQYMGN